MLRLLALALSLYSPRPDFDECVRYWQRELGLTEWNITVEVVRRTGLDDATVGDIEPNLRRKTAVLRILDEDDYDLPRRQARADQRLTVAHEMVHLQRFALGRDAEWRDEDTTVAQTFELLRRKGRWRELIVAER